MGKKLTIFKISANAGTWKDLEARSSSAEPHYACTDHLMLVQAFFMC